MKEPIRYEPAVAEKLLSAVRLDEIRQRLVAARQEVFDDVELLKSGQDPPEGKQPLDAGFIELPRELLDQQQTGQGGLLSEIGHAARELREAVDRVVLLGIGGSYMGTRALFEALCHPYHNELTRSEREQVPRLHFEGNNLDNDALSGLLDLLTRRCADQRDVCQRWATIVISKSGGTLETAVAFRLFRQLLEEHCDAPQSQKFVVPITGESGKLRAIATAAGYPNVFPIPDNVGGRFSVFTAVGLFPAAVLNLDVGELLRGAADMTERFRQSPPGENPVLDYVAVCHLFEIDHGMTIRVLSTWGKRLEAVGLWYDQLLAESLGKQEAGPTPLTAVNTRDLHSRGQQHQEGRRDKLITNLRVESPSLATVTVPHLRGDHDGLNRLEGRPISTLLSAAVQGTNKAYESAARPTADIVLPELNAYTLGQLLQMLMLATAVEGRLTGINPYGQPGVEAYKANMKEILGLE